jgi:hypothetical protein
MRLIYILLFLTSLVSHAQNGKKANNSDLRNNDTMFSLEVTGNVQKNVVLVRNNMKEFVLLFGQGDKQSRLRLSSQRMREVDTEFVQRYFQVSLVLGDDKAKCDELYRLILRGDKAIVCKHQAEKVKEVEKLLSYFNGLKK